MKRNLAIIAGLVAMAAMLNVTPGSAAVSQKVRNACERKAALVLPALRASEKEAYIANCLANATAPRR